MADVEFARFAETHEGEADVSAFGGQGPFRPNDQDLVDAFMNDHHDEKTPWVFARAKHEIALVFGTPF